MCWCCVRIQYIIALTIPDVPTQTAIQVIHDMLTHDYCYA